MNNVNETLKERGNSYGSFEAGSESIGKIMSVLDNLHIGKTGNSLNPTDFQALNFVVIKLVRLGATPSHLDSWHDVQGYANLAETMYSTQTKEGKE